MVPISKFHVSYDIVSSAKDLTIIFLTCRTSATKLLSRVLHQTTQSKTAPAGHSPQHRSTVIFGLSHPIMTSVLRAIM